MTHGPTTKPTAASARAEKKLADFALAYPGVEEHAPWGHRAFKIKNKVFLFLGADADGLGLSVKLPMSSDVALTLPFAKPTAYGLGKSGWVSAQLEPKAAVPIEMLCEWIDESFRAIAPKKVVAALDGGAIVASPAKSKRGGAGRAARAAGRVKASSPAKRRR